MFLERKLIFNLNLKKLSLSLLSFNYETAEIKEEFFYEKEIDWEKKEKIAFVLDRVLSELIEKFLRDSDYYNNPKIFFDEVLFFVSEPWAKTETYSLTDEKAVEFALDEKYFNKFFNYQENIGGVKIGQNIISLKVNEYELDFYQAINKKVRKIEANFLEAKISIEFSEIIDSAIKKYFNLVYINFISLTNFLIEDFILENNKENFIFIYQAKEKAEVGVYEDGLIKKIALWTFSPYAFELYLEKKNKKLSKKINLFFDNILEKKEKKKIEKELDAFVEEKKKELVNLLGEKKYQDLNVFVFGFEERRKIKKIFERNNFFNQIIFYDKKKIFEKIFEKK